MARLGDPGRLPCPASLNTRQNSFPLSFLRPPSLRLRGLSESPGKCSSLLLSGVLTEPKSLGLHLTFFCLGLIFFFNILSSVRMYKATKITRGYLYGSRVGKRGLSLLTLLPPRLLNFIFL